MLPIQLIAASTGRTEKEGIHANCRRQEFLFCRRLLVTTCMPGTFLLLSSKNLYDHSVREELLIPFQWRVNWDTGKGTGPFQELGSICTFSSKDRTVDLESVGRGPSPEPQEEVNNWVWGQEPVRLEPESPPAGKHWGKKIRVSGDIFSQICPSDHQIFSVDSNRMKKARVKMSKLWNDFFIRLIHSI